MLRLIITFLLIPCFITLTGQSHKTLLKTPYEPENDTPKWAVEMYKDSPKVLLVDKLFKEFYETSAFEKNVHTQNYKHWRRAIEPYLNKNGEINLPDVNELNKHNEEIVGKKATATRSGNSWTTIGPYQTFSIDANQVPVSWQGNVYSIDQSKSNPEIVYVGTEAGGVFKSIDKGQNWTHASFGSTMRSVTTVKVHPTNPDVVYAGDNQNVYKTINGGHDWSVMLGQNGLGANDILIKPSDPNDVFVASANGLYRSQNGGQDWSQILTARIWDMEMKPNDPNTIYVMRSNNSEIRTELWKSIDGGDNFILRDSGWYSSDDPDRINGGGRMTVTPADPNRVYVILIGQSKLGDNGFIGVYRSDDCGESWMITDPPVGGPYNSEHNNLATLSNTNTLQQGYYNLGIAASHENADHFLVGCLNLWRSTDGGTSFQALGGYQGSVSWIHPDQQEIEINGGDYWVVNDGGINYSTDMFSTHESRAKGMYASDFWGFGSGWNEDLVVGGRYHNGNTAYRPSFENGQFMRLGGAEAATGYVQPGGESIAYFSDISAKKIPYDLSDAVENVSNFTMFPSESFYAAHYSELEFDPNCYSHIYIGRDNKLYKSENNGLSFETIGEFGEPGQPVMQFEISRIDNNVIYVYQRTSFYGATLWCSLDGGQNWSQKPFPTGISSMRAGVLAIHSQDPSILWAAFAHQNNDGNKLWRSDDFGNSWTNITKDILDGETINALFHHAGTENDLYIGTNFSVYRHDGENIELCSDGLPMRFVVNRFAPFYKENKLRVATYGSGIWEMSLVEEGEVMAQATVDKRRSNCSRDTFYFDDYSVVQHDDNISWEWRFSPEPVYVSDKNARNPKVVFGQLGSFDVELVVTNNTGSSTFSRNNMIQIDEDVCRPDGFPGKSFVSNGTGVDYVQLPSINQTLETFTLTAWIKPMGSQPDYSGIVFNDNISTGMNVTPGNRLGFHYQDAGSAAWAWNSGLDLHLDQWNYVAMVVEPSGVRLYVNEKSNFRELDLDPAVLGTMKLGSYQGWGSRNFIGEMDEVTIWDRALSEEEVHNNRHITKELTAEGLMHYYQFNEEEGAVLDRIGLMHGNLSGTSFRTDSDAAVGRGFAETRYVDDTNNIDLLAWSDNVSLKVQAMGPLGEALTVSQIDLLPSNTEVEHLFPASRYWIINGLTTNINRVVIEGEGVESYYENLPQEISLFNRSSNSGFENSWGENTTAVSVNALNDIIDFTTNLLPSNQVILSKAIISSTEETTNEIVGVFPNPTSGAVSVQGEVKKGVFTLYDSKGQRVFQSELLNSERQMTLPDKLAGGVYYFVIDTGKTLKTGKVFLVKP